MRHKLLIFFGILSFGLIFADAVRAADDVFVVVRVPVTAEAERATDAKALAQAEGRRRAVDILLRRLTAEEDWVYLPRLSDDTQGAAAGRIAPASDAYTGDAYASATGAAKQAVYLDDTRLVDLESGFEVLGEKSSATRYRALITYRFKPEEIRRLLKRAGIPYSEAQMRTALVLPVLQTEKSVYLWEERNPWMAAWKSRPYTYELTPIIAPLGDLEDSARITARQALALDQDALAEMAAHYGVSQVIVAHARLTQANDEDRLTVRLINGYRESGQSAGIAALDDQLAADDPYAEPGEAVIGYSAGADEDFAAEVGDVLGASTGSRPSGGFRMLAESQIDAAITKYASGWKERTLIDHASESILTVSAFFDNLGDWSRIRGALIASPLVGAAQISALSRRGAEMSVRVFGDPSRLQVSMENQGVVFWSETGDRWFLATPRAASRLRGQRFLRQSAVDRPAIGDGSRTGPGRSYEDRVYNVSSDDADPDASSDTGNNF